MDERSGKGPVQVAAVARDTLKMDVDNDISTEATVHKMLMPKDASPNVEMLLRMNLTPMISNGSLERSFSKLNMIKEMAMSLR